MIVDLDALDLDDRAEAALAFREVVESGAEVAFSLPVEGGFTFSRGGDVTWVRGDVGTEVTLACARCTRPFRHRLVARFREGYRIGAAAGEGGAGAEGFSPGPAMVTLTTPQLDLTEVVRQHLLLAVPMAPLCRPECRGLCPTCGADRNERVCGCVVDVVDPRLSALRAFRPVSE